PPGKRGARGARRGAGRRRRGRDRRAPRRGADGPHPQPGARSPARDAPRERRGLRRRGACRARRLMSAIPIRLRGETLPMTTELLDRYNVQGPRYTSYPTAPEWNESVRAAAYEEACARANASGAP